MPVTTTAYKTINESVEHTPSIKSTAGIPEPSPSTHNHLLSTTEVVTITKFTTKTIASVTTIPCSRIVPINDVQQNESVVNQSQCSQALGALLGLVVVVLAVVITGWVWTCWIMKKKGGMKLTSNKHER